MKKRLLIIKRFILFIILLPYISFSQFNGLIPENTATHVALRDGNWSNPSIWSAGNVPRLASIVIIPKGITVNYNANNNAHIFAIRLDGNFVIDNPDTPRKLVVDSFMGGSDSFININASSPSSSTVEIVLKAFDIERKKSGQIAGANWNNAAKNHYKDRDVVKDHFGNNFPDDGPGVLGRYSWDPKQATIALMTHGKVRINGQDKLDFSECSKNIGRGSNKIDIKDTPTGWKVGDQILLAGTKNRNQSEIFTVRSINGKSITVDKNTAHVHNGVNLSGTNYYTYTGNLTRNIVIRSSHRDTQVNLTRRGHVMFMFNGNVDVKNTQFKDLGRTDKSNILDDLKFGVPVITGTGNQTKINLPNFANQFENNPAKIENQRGRYAVHFHKTLRGKNKRRLANAIGNVVWGSPGWGMVHHDSHANFTDNVILDVEGGAMVAESGSETGIWKHNFVTGEKIDNTVPFLNNQGTTAPMRRYLRFRLDDDFKSSEAFCLQGRAIEMVDNVAGAVQRGYNYQGNGQNLIVADKLNTDIFEASGKVNPFPFDNEVTRTLAPFIRFDNNTAFNTLTGFKSQTRNGSGAYHRVTSIINNLVVWNVQTFGIYFSSNFGYLVNNSKLHSVNTSNQNNTAALIHIGNDNLNFNNTKFYNWKNRGAQVIDANNGNISSNPNAQFVFNKVEWLNSPSNFNPYANDPNKNLKITNINVNPNYKVRFEKSNNMDDVINLNNGDYKFTIRGRMIDQIGNANFGNYSPKDATENLTRVYDFQNQQNIVNKLLNGRPFLSDNRGQYIEFIEYINNRISNAPPTAVAIKIYVKGFTLGTPDIDNVEKEVKIYPNPTSHTITINKTDNSSLEAIEIYNINGQKLFHNNYKSSTATINISSFQNGVYFIRNKKFTKSFVKN